jgi:type III pantothenate kinase
MNIIAVDIGNTNITTGLFLDGQQEFVKSVAGKDQQTWADLLTRAWKKIPIVRGSKEKKRNGVIVVSSVKPAWTTKLRQAVKKGLGEKIHLIGKEIPLPIDMKVDEPTKVGTDRVVAAAAAYDVVAGAVAIVDIGTALTIDLVDEKGSFQGGVICPGLEMSAQALKDSTAVLPKVKVTRPKAPYGKNTADAINCGLYYSAVATIQEIIGRYAEQLGSWPQTVLTGSAAKIIKDDCEFIDSYVPNLVIKGVVLAFQKYIEEKTE